MGRERNRRLKEKNERAEEDGLEKGSGAERK